MKQNTILIKKFIFLTIVVLFFSFSFNDFALAALAPKCADTVDSSDCPLGQKCVEQEIGGATQTRCARALEIIYPRIPGDPMPVPETVASGIPEYFKYAFQLAVVLIGLIIFGIFVYYGTKYLSSVDKAAAFADAKAGMTASLLGAVILLGAYIVFVTINPQLIMLSLPSTNLLEQPATPGVYICNYEYDGNSVTTRSIGEIISDSIYKKQEEQIEAYRELQSVIVNPDATDQKCSYVFFSGNFQNFTVKDDYTMFVIPSIEEKYDDTVKDYVRKPIFQHGAILHEKDDFAGECKIYPEAPNDLYYTFVSSEGEISDMPYPATRNNPISDYNVGTIGFDARSITVFAKPAENPSSDKKGLIMYMCIEWDRTGVCPVDDTYIDPATGLPRYSSSGGAPPELNTGGTWDNRHISTPIPPELVDIAPDKGGLRSVKIDQSNLFFAVFRDDDNKCAVIKGNNLNISTLRIDKCGPRCDIAKRAWWNAWGVFGLLSDDCVACINEIDVIKGRVL